LSIFAGSYPSSPREECDGFLFHIDLLFYLWRIHSQKRQQLGTANA